MPVAPSYKNFEFVDDPALIKGKMYVTVKNPKTGNLRSVRWYSEAEYAKAYGNKEKAKDDGFDGLKKARGFEKGPILVIRSNKPSDEVWLGESCARYAVGIGWYIISTAVWPEDAPAHFKYLLLSWDEFRDGDDRHMKKPDVLANILVQKAKAKQYVDMRASRPMEVTKHA